MEERLKHLDFIQGAIMRMNTNSFMIRGWTVVLLSAIFALAAKEADSRYLLVACFALPAFWALDAIYVSQERQYRGLYNDVRKGAVEDFLMDASSYNKGNSTWTKAAFSKTTLLFYLPMLLAVIIVVVWTIVCTR